MVIAKLIWLTMGLAYAAEQQPSGYGSQESGSYSASNDAGGGYGGESSGGYGGGGGTSYSSAGSHGAGGGNYPAGVATCPVGSAATFVRISRAKLGGSPAVVSEAGSDTACAQYCRGNKVPNSGAPMNCASFNYDGKGTCYFYDNAATPAGSGILSPNADAGSFYYEKVCLPGISPHLACVYRSYAFERLRNSRLEGFVRKSIQTLSREACLTACLTQTEFICKSANYNYNTKFCEMSDQDRRSKPQYIRHGYGDPMDYFDNNCLTRQNRCGPSGGNLVFVKSENFEIHYHDRSTIEESSESYCLQKCLDSVNVYCRSVEYDPKSRRCVLSDEDTFSRADAQGVAHGYVKNYYEPICVASDLSSSTCRQQAAFTRTIGQAIQAQPIASAKHVTVSDCISLCFQNLDCKSLNYDRTEQTCFVFDTSSSDKYAKVKPNPSIDYYKFHCESQFGGLALCTDQGIKFIVNTKEPYTGAIYAAERFHSCNQVVTNQRQIMLVFPPPTVTNKCGTQFVNGRLVADVVVSLDGVLPHQVTTEWDRFYRVSCDTTLQGIGEGSVVVTTIFDTGDTDPIPLAIGTPGPVTAQLMFVDRGGQTVTSTNIGELIYLVAKSPEAGPNNMMLMDCVASRVAGTGSTVPFKVIDNGCPTYPALVGPVTRDFTNNRLAATMKAFRLDGSYDIQMTCTVIFCAGPNGCAPSNCLDAATYQIFQSFGKRRRRRRDVEVTTNNATMVYLDGEEGTLEDYMENEVKEEKLTAFIRVLADGEVEDLAEVGHLFSPQLSDSEMLCIDESVFIAIIASVSLLCLLFSGVIIAWGCRRLRGVEEEDYASTGRKSIDVMG